MPTHKHLFLAAVLRLCGYYTAEVNLLLSYSY
jgi:hypothetical protein